MKDVIAKTIFPEQQGENKVDFIKDLKINEIVTVEGKVVSKKLQQTKAEKIFLLITIADKTGSIRIIDWFNPEENYEEISKDKIIEVKGKIVSFDNRLQLNLSREKDSLQLIDEKNVNPEKYLNESAVSAEKMIQELMNLLEKIEDESLKKFMKEIFNENDYIKDLFFNSPAAMSIHHAHRGGLLEHSLSVANLCLNMNKVYNELANNDILISGAILHDLGKIKEYIIKPQGIEKTDEGELLGHIYLGVEIFNEIIKKSKIILNKSFKEHILHIILSHHGEIEFGSPVVPKTLEALIIHLCDYSDSKIAQASDNIEIARKVDPNSTWSEYDKRLGTKMHTKL